MYFCVRDSYPFNIFDGDERNELRFKHKHAAIEHRFKLFEDYLERSPQDIIKLYRKGKVYRILTKEIIEMDYEERLEKYPEYYI